MGFDYALVHLKYTIPPALLLTVILRPLLALVDWCKIAFLISVSVFSTIPWDSHLIRTRVWSYPPEAVIGFTLFDIPLEELFFFVIQTYNTTLLYILLSRATLFPVHLRKESKSFIDQWRVYQLAGMMALGGLATAGMVMIRRGGNGTYMGLILAWATPFCLLLWSLSYQLILGLPRTNTLIPILLPTFYLWMVDTFALRRGTWVIEHGTKFGVQLWDGLEIEEAVFFLVTNVMIVFGMITCDNSMAILEAFPSLFPRIPAIPGPALVATALLMPASEYDQDRITGLQEAVTRLQRKSRSFYLASGTFRGRLRIDLILLYSFCRVGDDLVDEAGSPDEATRWISSLRRFLDLSYGTPKQKQTVTDFVNSEFPAHTRLALLQLPTAYLTPKPLYDLLLGFETDLIFTESNHRPPIQTIADLDLYGARVAGTVAELCLELVFHHHASEAAYPDTSISTATKARLIRAGGLMGVALQYVNISRDIAVDAAINRVYVPQDWLRAEGLSHKEILERPEGERVEQLRTKLLDRAFALYEEARPAIEELPSEARGPMRVAVQSYMEIGRVLRQKGYRVKAGRATVPKLRRIRVAWESLD